MEDVHQLRTFRAVAQQLSFTRAAESLFLTQSAVSHQIAALERSLNTPLFARQGRSVTLTPAGRALFAQTTKVFKLLDETTQIVRQAARPDLGRLRIAASPTACQYLIPESVREFRESYPSYSLAITVEDSPRTTELVQQNLTDLGIIIRAERNRRLTCHDLFTDTLGFLVSPLHPWARAGKVDKATIPAQAFVLYTRSSTTFRIVERYLVRMGSPLEELIELGSMEAIKELVKLGLGVTVAARWIAEQELREGSLVWLPTPAGTLKRTWSIAVAANRRLSIAEQTFVELCRATGRNLVEE